MILVTGASGHLGGNLVRRLLADGETVRVLIREGSNNQAVEGLAVERVSGDLRDPLAARAAVRGCSHVYHCAAKISTVAGSEREIYDCNVLGTKNLLAAARETVVERVVVTGSFSAVGHEAGQRSDETMPFYPFDSFMPYEWTKTLVELECLRAATNGLEVVIATSCAILGPNDYKPSRVGSALLDFGHGRMPAYVDGGFEFVATRDIVEGHVLAMERGRSGHKYIFSTEFVTMGELLAIFAEATGQSRTPIKLPGALMYGVAAIVSPILTRLAPQFPQRFTPAAIKLLRAGWRADTSKARVELGYRPSTVREAVVAAWDDFTRRGLTPQSIPAARLQTVVSTGVSTGASADSPHGKSVGKPVGAGAVGEVGASA